MIEICGKFNTAKVFTDVVDESSIAQITQLCNQSFTEGARIRMMPDVHAGAGCTIGTTMTITDKVVPNLVGVDIGCGMETVRLRESHIELAKLDKLIYKAIPSGFSIRQKPHRYAADIDLTTLRCYKDVDTRRGELSIGTLGGGNHFIEADRDNDGNLYLVVHSGSRHLGLEVAKYYQEQAYHQCNGSDQAGIDAMIELGEGKALLRRCPAHEPPCSVGCGLVPIISSRPRAGTRMMGINSFSPALADTAPFLNIISSVSI